MRRRDSRNTLLRRMKNGLDQRGPGVQVAGGATLGVDVAEHGSGSGLWNGQCLGQFRGAVAVIAGPEGQIHLMPGQGEIKLVLALRQAVGVGGRGGVAHGIG